MRRLLGLAVLALAPQPVLGWTVDDVVSEARDFCAGFDNGQITVAPTAVQTVELTGEGEPETIIDWGGIDCSTMASPWGGTGGSTLTILAGGQRFDHMAFGWQVVDFDGPVLLLAQHGINCNATGADRCVQALIWTAGTLTGAGWPVSEDEGGAMPEGEGNE
ncbi:MAG: hypothetical protein MUE52_12635 [Tabrizicola sp.]|jgi:hypothetical protein|nr:hypothetical protein [Tabrizicola sp.]